MTQTVKVMVRCRPMNRRQKQLNCQCVVKVQSAQNQIGLLKPNSKDHPKPFTFDHVFGQDSLQSYVYQQTAFSLVDNVLEGYNGTIFAYGQTGCGKTHTMMGVNDSDTNKGIIPRTFTQIITFTGSQTQKKHLVRCSFIQIYNEEIHDLLGKNTKGKLDLKESPDKGVFVKDLTMHIVKTTDEMEKFMDIGFKNRATRQTAMNKQSSRSHSLFTIHIQSQQIDELGKQKFKAGKLNLVDLAGSQRQSKTHATGDGMKQAAKINLSLSALGNVISALVDGKTQHIPYRDSKLTRLLQDSLGGNTKTIMIAAISPASDNYEQTLSTLRYASRAKFIQNKPIINQDPKDTLLRQYAEEIKMLKAMLQGKMPMNQAAIQSMSKQNSQVITKYIQIQGNNGDGGNNEHLQNELQNKDDLLKNQQNEKQRLKQQLQNLQGIVGKQNTQTQKDKKELERMKKLKQKLKSQKKKEQQWKQQSRKRQHQLLSMQKNYKSLNEEVEEMRLRFKQIKSKYIQNLQQLRDIRQQHQRQKQQILDTVRFQEVQIKKFSGICSMLLTQDQIQHIISESQYNDQTRQWLIAPFYYRDRNVNFPKLPAAQTKELIQFQKDKKELVFRDLTRKQQLTKAKATYRISDVVKNARQHDDHDLSNMNMPSQKRLKNIKNHQTLIPLKSDSEHKLRNDEQERTSTIFTNNMNNMNKVKLNPLNPSSKKDILKQDYGGY